MDSRNIMDRHRTKEQSFSSMRKRPVLLILALGVLLTCSPSSSLTFAHASTLKSRALKVSSPADLETITSWEPSDPSRFNPHTGSLLAPFMIPRVSGTSNNTKVQEFILDYFAKLNATSLSGGVEYHHDQPIEDDGSKSQSKKHEQQQERKRQEREASDQLFRRAPGTPGTGWHLEKDTFVEQTPFGPKTFTNLIFTKNPNAENRLVFAAHFDSKYFPPKGTKPKHGWDGGEDTLPFIAATDSAAPCAILLDLAASLDRALDQEGRAEDPREATLQIVFFDGEEAFEEWSATDSLYGSRHLAQKWAQRIVPRSRTATGRNGGSTSNNLDGIELFILLDLLGAESPTVPSYFGSTNWAHQHTISIEQRLWDAKLLGAQALERKNRAQETVNEEDDEMDQLEADEPRQGFMTTNEPWGGIDDDHRPFLQRGVPIFHVIPTPFPNVWHTLKDNADAISQEVVVDWANIFRTFAVEYLQLMTPRERRRDEL
ncbi:hypothetical protein BGZ51_008192 [Haplosporangium sp. Z 767]|nr:hypothetical protein BGZ50_000878 [Haplosporangium sp. Z 11]KAF9190791.1 hypothetical protein BGZ51_008192 [Haplosporangium sp. Z 767]